MALVFRPPDRHRLAAGKFEVGDVNRDARCVSAQLAARRSVLIATREAGASTDCLDFGCEMASNDRYYEIANPTREDLREPAGDNGLIGKGDYGVGSRSLRKRPQAYRILDAAPHVRCGRRGCTVEHKSKPVQLGVAAVAS